MMERRSDGEGGAISDGLQHFGAVDNLVTAGADGSACSNPHAARQVGEADVMNGQRSNVERHLAPERAIRQKRTVACRKVFC